MNHSQLLLADFTFRSIIILDGQDCHNAQDPIDVPTALSQRKQRYKWRAGYLLLFGWLSIAVQSLISHVEASATLLYRPCVVLATYNSGGKLHIPSCANMSLPLTLPTATVMSSMKSSCTIRLRACLMVSTLYLVDIRKRLCVVEYQSTPVLVFMTANNLLKGDKEELDTLHSLIDEYVPLCSKLLPLT